MRQSAFALVGDLSRNCAPHLQAVLKQLLALAIQNMEAHCINLQNMSACNNACWSLGGCCLHGAFKAQMDLTVMLSCSGGTDSALLSCWTHPSAWAVLAQLCIQHSLLACHVCSVPDCCKRRSGLRLLSLLCAACNLNPECHLPLAVPAHVSCLRS